MKSVKEIWENKPEEKTQVVFPQRAFDINL